MTGQRPDEGERTALDGSFDNTAARFQRLTWVAA